MKVCANCYVCGTHIKRGPSVDVLRAKSVGDGGDAPEELHTAYPMIDFDDEWWDDSWWYRAEHDGFPPEEDWLIGVTF